MLLTLKEDNTTGSFCLYHLLCMLCTSVHSYTIIICNDGTVVCMCYWSLHVCYTFGYIYIDCSMYIYMDITKLWITSMLLLVSYNITTPLFCVMVSLSLGPPGGSWWLCLLWYKPVSHAYWKCSWHCHWSLLCMKLPYGWCCSLVVPSCSYCWYCWKASLSVTLHLQSTEFPGGILGLL